VEENMTNKSRNNNSKVSMWNSWVDC